MCPDTLQSFLGAYDALDHIHERGNQISRVFKNLDISEECYRTLVGFHEPLLKIGVLLQVIHVYIWPMSEGEQLPVTLLANSLGEVFSPYPAFLFTPNSLDPIPTKIFDKGNGLEFEDIIKNIPGVPNSYVVLAPSPSSFGDINSKLQHALANGSAKTTLFQKNSGEGSGDGDEGSNWDWSDGHGSGGQGSGRSTGNAGGSDSNKGDEDDNGGDPNDPPPNGKGLRASGPDLFVNVTTSMSFGRNRGGESKAGNTCPKDKAAQELEPTRFQDFNLSATLVSSVIAYLIPEN